MDPPTQGHFTPIRINFSIELGQNKSKVNEINFSHKLKLAYT